MPPNPNWVSHHVDTGSLGMSFLLTGHVSTDANENLHSQLRCNNNMHPQAEQRLAHLKVITLTHFEKCGTDDGATLIEYMRKKKQGLGEPVEIPETTLANPVPLLPLVTTQTLYYLTGWFGHI